MPSIRTKAERPFMWASSQRTERSARRQNGYLRSVRGSAPSLSVIRSRARRAARRPNRSGSVVDRRCGGNRPDRPIRHGWEVLLPLCCALAGRSASTVTGGIPSRLASGGTTSTGAGGRVPFGFPWRMDPASAGRWLVNHAAPPRSLAPCRQRPGPGAPPGLSQLCPGSAFGGRHRDVQSAPPPVLPAGASPGSAVLPGTTRLPPAAWVTFTRRAWAFGDAGMVTCRTPSA
jgi:hypothetical protein